MVTERDLRIMCFIDDFGFSKTGTIDEIFFVHDKVEVDKGKINMSIVRRRLRNLEKIELIESTRDFRSREKIFYLTSKGRAFLRSYGFSVFRNSAATTEQVKINWTNFKHDSQTIEIYKAFRRCGYGQMIPERSGRMQEIFSHNAPDLIILDRLSQFICVEVEMTQKSQERLQGKMTKMLSYENISHILYFFNDHFIEQALKKALDLVKLPSSKKKMIDLIPLNSFLSEPKEFLERILQ